LYLSPFLFLSALSESFNLSSYAYVTTYERKIQEYFAIFIFTNTKPKEKAIPSLYRLGIVGFMP